MPRKGSTELKSYFDFLDFLLAYGELVPICAEELSINCQVPDWLVVSERSLGVSFLSYIGDAACTYSLFLSDIGTGKMSKLHNRQFPLHLEEHHCKTKPS